MKKAFQYTFLTAFLTFASFICLQAQPHPNEQNGGGSLGGQRIGEGAPVGNGTFILLTLALAYAGRKTYKNSKTKEE